MSNSNNKRGTNYRWRLLSSVSALTLLGSAYASGMAEAAEQDNRPPLWLELGWQFADVSGGKELFMPAFADSVTSAAIAQKVLPYSQGPEAGISFQPEGSDWVISAQIRFGRAHGSKKAHQQTEMNPKLHITAVFPSTTYVFKRTFPGTNYAFNGVKASNAESYTILDFQAGKDVGLGIFGRENESTISFGARFARFDSKSGTELSADVPLIYSRHRSFYGILITTQAAAVREYSGAAAFKRSFHGIGPAISWNSTAPIAGNAPDGEVTLDWALNAALLFGKQKARGHHQIAERYQNGFGNVAVVYQTAHDPARSRSVTVPNIGGFAGMSLRYTNAKISLGYRADYFFNAIDSGIDTRKSENRGFFGPFASISLGLGGSDN